MRASPKLLMAIPLLLSGCDSLGNHDRAANAERNVRAAEQAWMADWASHDPNRVLARYAQDARVTYSGTTFWTGADQILKGLSPYIADPTFVIHFQADRVRVSKGGDLVATGGPFHVRYIDPAGNRFKQENGHYLAVWQKQADGSWKVAEYIKAVEPHDGR